MIPKLINMSKEFQSAYIQAFADGEGSAVLQGRHGRIEITQKDPSILYEIQESLEQTFRIVSRIRKVHYKNEKYDCHRLFIHGKHNLTRYRDNISFRVEKKRERLNLMCENYIENIATIEDYDRVIQLHKMGFTGREIKSQVPFTLRTIQLWVGGKTKPKTLHIEE